MKDIVFASHNKNKLREAQKILGEEFNVLGLDAIEITAEIEETAETLEGNAKIKAEYVWNQKKIPCFAEDSGIFIRALQNRPGVYSARYDGPGGDPVQKVLDEMTGQEDRYAEFIVCVIYVDETGNEKRITEYIPGMITTEKRGTLGWSYDTVFIPQGETRTYAELGPIEKKRVSPRVNALVELKNYLRNKNYICIERD